jgi:hypothetical protein
MAKNPNKVTQPVVRLPLAPPTRKIGRGVREVIDPKSPILNQCQKHVAERIVLCNNLKDAKKLIEYLKRRFQCNFPERCEQLPLIIRQWRRKS